MAQVHYVFEGPEDYAQCYLFKNKKKADAKVEELRADEDFMGDVEDDIAFLEVGSISYKEGFAVLLGSDFWPGQVKAMSADEFNNLAQTDEDGAFVYYTGSITDGTECYLDQRGNEYNGTQPTIAVADGDYEIGESVKTTFKYVPTFESFIGSQEVTESASSVLKQGNYPDTGFLKIDIERMESLYRSVYAQEFAKTRIEKELSFMKSLECAKTPNKAFKKILKEVESMIPWHNKQLKAHAIKIKQANKDFKEFAKDSNSKKAMEMMEELSQHIGTGSGVGYPRDVKYRYDYEYKHCDLTPSDKLACDKFIADIFKEYEAESAKAEKMDAEFRKYTDTLELVGY